MQLILWTLAVLPFHQGPHKTVFIFNDSEKSLHFACKTSGTYLKFMHDAGILLQMLSMKQKIFAAIQFAHLKSSFNSIIL